jgi:hypothetical protein
VEFEWNARKAARNLRKHKVSFIANKMNDELCPEYDLGQLLKGGRKYKIPVPRL